MRPSWHQYFLQIARLVATRATCDRLHVGCVIVSAENRILATGYNGSIKGKPHCDDVGHLISNGSCVRTVHAELNAILQAARYGISLDGSILYVTHSPCSLCQKHIANTGIRKIIYAEAYRADPLTCSRDIEETTGIVTMRIPYA